MLLPGKANENRNHPGRGLLSQDPKMRKSGRRSAKRFDRMNWDRVSRSGKAAGEIQQKIILEEEL
jgi:hypothetical protein